MFLEPAGSSSLWLCSSSHACGDNCGDLETQSTALRGFITLFVSTSFACIEPFLLKIVRVLGLFGVFFPPVTSAVVSEIVTAQ